MKNTTMKQLQPEYRPDEKFLAHGPESLTSAELLAIIVRTGNKEEHSVELSKKILHSESSGSENILSIFDYEIEDLMKIRGIGKVKALQIKAVAELSRRIAQSRAMSSLSFTDPDTVADYYMEQLRHLKREEVVVLMLDSACHLRKEAVINVGTVNASLFSPREIFIEALRCDAVNIILLHNHPSGSARPSSEDIQSTRKVHEAGRLLGIQLLDHIIIGDCEYCSMRREGLIHE